MSARQRPKKPGRARPARREPIVSSAHLAAGRSAELSELEYGLIIAGHAFERWAARCAAAAGKQELGTTEVLVLHHVHHRAREKKVGDIAFTLNVDDTHVVGYALKKLLGVGLVRAERRGKEVLYSTSEAGRALIRKYSAIREQLLVSALEADALDGPAIAELARFLRVLSGLYDQAARAASSL